MHTHETLARINAEWPHPLSHQERRERLREAEVRMLEERLGASVDRDHPMLAAMARMAWALSICGA